MFNWFSKKREMELIKEEVRNSFSDVKKDIHKVSEWVNYLNNKDDALNSRLNDLSEDLSSVKDQLEQLKDVISLFGDGLSKHAFKTNSPRLNKQTAVLGVEGAVQTPVQTGNFNNFLGISNLSITERAIIWVLANSELKLSYDDLSAMLGKTRSTIRGQINSIKQKSEGLIEEYVEQNGKKRVYIPQEIREKIVKNIKVRVQKEEKKSKRQKGD